MGNSEWCNVLRRPKQGDKVRVMYCLPKTVVFGKALYKDGSYWNSKGALLDTPSYWRSTDQ